MGFWEDIRRDFKGDCEKYGKPLMYGIVLVAITSPAIACVLSYYAEAISGAVSGKLETVIGIWAVAAESVPCALRGPCYFGSVVLMLAVGFVTPLACEGAELAGRRRFSVALRLSLALCGAIMIYGAFAVAVLCIDASEGTPRLWILCQAVLAFASVLYGVVRVSSAPVFNGE